MNSYLKKLFIDEAKAAIDARSSFGGSGGGGESGIPITVNTASDMDAILASATAADNGKVYQYLGETTEAYEQNAYYILEV